MPLYGQTLYSDDSLKLKFIKDYFTYELNTNYGICSFSYSHDDNVLWSHYAERATGICVVFRKSRLLSSLKNELDTYYQIQPDFVRYRGIEKLIFDLSDPKDPRATQKHLYSKTKHWKYEKEFRIIIRKKFKEFHDFKYPDNFVHLMPFNPTTIHSIIIGENMSSENKELLDNLLLDKKYNIPIREKKFS